MKHYLETVKWPVIGCINYKGRLLWKIIGGYQLGTKIVKTPQEVDELIKESLQSLSKSVRG